MFFYYRLILTAVVMIICLNPWAILDVLGVLETFKVDEITLKQAETQYGLQARQRLLAWEKLIQTDIDRPDAIKLERVNNFINLIHFTSDMEKWGKKDYWATPIEFLAGNGGDCEDFSVAKYFTLRIMGVPDNRLYLTYVKALRLNQAHMVLAYYAQPDAEPIILDNLIGEIKPASKRVDLIPVYSFNGSGLWLAKQRGQGKMVGDSRRLKLWRELIERMPKFARAGIQ